jgi:hypothetical protein
MDHGIELARYPLFFAGVSFVLYGLWASLWSVRRCSLWAKAEGNIIGYDEHPDRGLFAPKIQFTGLDGCTHVFVSEVFGSKDHPIGGRIFIRYSRENPEHAEVARYSNLWLFPLVWLGFGVGFLLASILTPQQK